AIRAELSSGLWGIPVDREVGRVARSDPILSHEFPRQIIEAGPQILETVSKHCRQMRLRGFDNSDSVDSFVSIILKHKSAEVSLLQPVSSFVIESAEVFLGPIEFHPSRVKRVTHEVDSAYGEEAETAHAEGCGDPGPEARRLPSQPEESRRAREITPPR